MKACSNEMTNILIRLAWENNHYTGEQRGAAACQVGERTHKPLACQTSGHIKTVRGGCQGGISLKFTDDVDDARLDENRGQIG
ncbi:hypothetical protein NUBL17188_39160 [Klebsiella pneumoniae]|nr:hypothetical protein NUBL17188_39160 [Klebsiella pneumoniae]